MMQDASARVCGILPDTSTQRHTQRSGQHWPAMASSTRAIMLIKPQLKQFMLP